MDIFGDDDDEDIQAPVVLRHQRAPAACIDADPRPAELRDVHGIYAWYRKQFYPAELEGSFDWGRLFGLMSRWQAEFNEMTSRPCRGLGFMRIAGRGKAYCNHPMCPSCWHRHHAEALAFLKVAQSQTWPYVFVRQTLWVKWCEQMYFPMVRLFKARRSKYRLLVYTLNMEAAGEVIDPVADEFNGELACQLLGVFVSDRLVRDLFTDRASNGNQAHLYDENNVCRGVICRDVCKDVTSARDRWMELLRHPWLYRKHSLFPEYISHFISSGYPTGRSWVRMARVRGSAFNLCDDEAESQS